jgi:hypothetical protein
MFRPVWPTSIVKMCSGKTAAIYCVVTACVVPQMRTRVVRGVSCSFLFFVASLVLDSIKSRVQQDATI